MSALQIETVEPARLPLASITRDPELACRAAGVNKATASEYSVVMLTGAAFPPVVVFADPKGTHWLADGFHRCAAAELAGFPEIAADVRPGTRRDALLYAATANTAHGLRRTSADKRRAIELVLAAFPKWSDRKIADACGVHNETVGAVRKRVTDSVTSDPVEPVETLAPTSDQVVARLSKSLDRVLKAWPPERLGELRMRVLEACPPEA